MTEQKHQDSISLVNILIGSGIIFATLFFFGYWHLSWYFKQVGTLIPIYELEAIFIAQIGFLQLLTIGIPIFSILLFKKNYQKKLFLIGTIVPFILVSAIIASLLAIYDKAFNATWLSFIVENRVPNVEIVYTVPLANKELPAGSIYESVSKNVNSEDVNFQDKIFNDDLGNKRYVAQFKLYFESTDNYYLKSNAVFCELYGLLAKEALIKKNEPIASANSPLFILSDQPSFTISVKDISPEILNNISNKNIFSNSPSSQFNFNFPNTYIIEPLDYNPQISEEEEEYKNKRECKLIILPKVKVESLKYYK